MKTKEPTPLIVYISLFFAAFGSLWLAWETAVELTSANSSPQGVISGVERSTNELKEAVVKTDTAFRDGVNAAIEAANLTQTAKTPQEWTTVASLWQQALGSMGNVPATDSNYAVAQQKLVEYQRNLEYARKNAVLQTSGTSDPSTKP